MKSALIRRHTCWRLAEESEGTLTELMDHRVAVFRDLASPAGVASFTWHDLLAHGTPRELPAAPLTMLSASDCRASSSVDLGTWSARTVARAMGRAHRLADFLGDESVTPGDRILCTRTGAGAPHELMPYVTIGTHSEHFAIHGLSELTGRIDDFRHVTLITGVCLFSEKSSWGYDGDGRRVSLGMILSRPDLIKSALRGLEVDPRFSLYELETSTRLSCAVAGFVSALPSNLPCEVVLQVPRIQYYLYLIPALQAGLIKGQHLLEWFDLVDMRFAAVVEKFQRLLRGCSVSAQSGRIASLRVSAVLSDHEAVIREHVAKNKYLDLNVFIQRLIFSDPTWERALSVSPVSGWRDAANLSYAVEFASSHSDEQDGRLLIAIDSPMEQKIFRTFQRILKTTNHGRRSGALGVFPMERAIVLQSGQLTNSYYLDPGHTLLDEVGDSYSPEELVERLYPVSIQSASQQNRRQGSMEEELSLIA
jgi:hypothetical protein